MKFFIDLFRKFPVCTGLLCLVVISNLTESKDLQTPILSMQKDLLPIFFLYTLGMWFYMMFVLPSIPPQKREKTTWLLVVIGVVVLTIFM